MKRTVAFLFAFVLTGSVFAADLVLDTIYFSKDYKEVAHSFYANQYRIYERKSDPEALGLYKDFYMSGVMSALGTYKEAVRGDMTRWIYEGEQTTYYENGQMLCNWFIRDNTMDGTFTRYVDDSGEVWTKTEYRMGKPKYDYYTVYNKHGYQCKVHLADDTPVMETPDVSERDSFFIDEEKWQLYNRNNFWISAFCETTRDYGKWYRIHLFITNNTVGPIEFDPDSISATLVTEEGKTDTVEVLTMERYLKGIKKRQMWVKIGKAFADGLAAFGSSGNSTTFSQTNYSGNAYSGGDSYSYSGTASTTQVTFSNNNERHEKSQAETAAMNASHYRDMKDREKQYLKRHTINKNNELGGYVNLKYAKGTRLNVFVKVGDAVYTFSWDLM